MCMPRVTAAEAPVAAAMGVGARATAATAGAVLVPEATAAEALETAATAGAVREVLVMGAAVLGVQGGMVVEVREGVGMEAAVLVVRAAPLTLLAMGKRLSRSRPRRSRLRSSRLAPRQYLQSHLLWFLRSLRLWRRPR